MEILVERRWKKAAYTIGRMSIDGVAFCDTLEDKDRGLRKDMTLTDLRRLKLDGKTAIPSGRYEVSLRVYSPKFGGKEFYKRVCGGKVPRVLNVPCFDGVLIHCGNTAEDTLGCVLVGRNTKVGALSESQKTFEALYERLAKADSKGERITIKIV